ANESRYAFFSRAVLEAARALHLAPDIIHVHDWHASLVPAYAKAQGVGAATVVTIHNIAFQGRYDLSVAPKIGFDPASALPGGVLEHEGGANYLKAGLVTADAVTTVSRTYAQEIQSGPEFGMGLEKILSARSKDVTGIVNGVDPELWGPTNDPLIAHRFGIDAVAAGKAANKADLQRRMGLQQDPDAPIFAVASRLSHQKGIDIVLDAVHSIVGRGGQLVISGAGDPELEKRVAEIVKFYSYYGRVAFHTFDEAFVHAVYASADFLLMPSRFEPCGLSQLIAQRYATLPIVARTGGLADTVRDLRDDPENGDGLFVLPAQDGGIWETINDAYAGYRNPEALAAARRSAMAKDSSWGPALDQYEALFRRLAAPPAPAQ
ncbi:MAG: glycogen synthase, partial [Elusimicrobia bacterium]|nr:glycogen synthase [Elusimicrobiota bacterium]